jgi:hypothetical protein
VKAARDAASAEIEATVARVATERKRVISDR